MRMETGLLTTVFARQFESPTVDSLAEKLAGVAAVTQCLSEIRRDEVVFLKIDLGDSGPYNPSDVTNPVLIAAVARLFRAAGARVLVGDSPFRDGRPVQPRWREAGLERLARREGFELVELEAEATRVVPVEDVVYYIPRVILRASIVVNLARARADVDFAVAGAITNLGGTLPGGHGRSRIRGSRRPERRAQQLVDLYAIIQPGLTIADLGTGGDVTALIGVDGVAVDCVTGRSEALHVRMAAEAGLGIGWPEGIRVDGCDRERLPVGGLIEAVLNPRAAVSRLRSLAAGVLEPWLWSRPRLKETVCNSCGECVKCCPTKTLRMVDGGRRVRVVEPLCISCWRCSRICDKGALVPERSRMLRLLE
jgi:ferredoxin